VRESVGLKNADRVFAKRAKGEQVRGKAHTSVIALAALTLAFTVAGSANARTNSGGSIRKTTSLVFGTDADPALLDPALVSDGPSLRTTDQIFESLVGFKLGGTNIVPELATKWSHSPNGLAWTFTLRRGVKFQDGTKFNAAAVCFNFNRWFNFPAPLQSDALSYYWQTVFGGFAQPAAGNPGPDKSLYKGCRTRGASKVTLLLTRRSSSFLAALGLPNFGIASPTALKKYKADAGTVDAGGVFRPSGTFATKNPVGTGPYKFSSWEIGSKLELVKNTGYWGRKAKLSRVIFQPIGDVAARLQALQSGEIQGLDGAAPADWSTIRGNKSLKLLKRPTFSVGYVGINQSIAPMNNPLVRQAVAYGLDRASVVKFYAGNGRLANQFLPPALSGFAKKGVPKYTYNPEKAKSLLRQAGLSLPVKVEFWYPTNVSRPYMPEPSRNFQAFQASLEKSGFNVVPHSGPWRPDYRAGVQAGRYQLFLFGWIADFADPADFLNVHFGSFTKQFGFTNDALFNQLKRADGEPNSRKRVKLYQQASIQVMKFLPVVPYVWAGSAVAVRKNVAGYITDPIGPVNEPFSLVSVGGS
jgi:peptide/nickel transport system substrate-binding protein